jgi:hypothetical protein
LSITQSLSTQTLHYKPYRRSPFFIRPHTSTQESADKTVQFIVRFLKTTTTTTTPTSTIDINTEQCPRFHTRRNPSTATLCNTNTTATVYFTAAATRPTIQQAAHPTFTVNASHPKKAPTTTGHNRTLQSLRFLYNTTSPRLTHH